MPRKAVTAPPAESSPTKRSRKKADADEPVQTEVSSKPVKRRSAKTPAESPALKTVKRIPASENGSGVLCRTVSGREFQITQCLNTGTHTLWRKTPDGYGKLASAKSPFDLYPMIPWDT